MKINKNKMLLLALLALNNKLFTAENKEMSIEDNTTIIINKYKEAQELKKSIKNDEQSLANDENDLKNNLNNDTKKKILEETIEKTKNNITNDRKKLYEVSAAMEEAARNIINSKELVKKEFFLKSLFNDTYDSLEKKAGKIPARTMAVVAAAAGISAIFSIIYKTYQYFNQSIDEETLEEENENK